MIIDSTHFVDRPYKVPNQEESKDFVGFIESKEADLGRKYLLGQALYTEFAAAIAAGGTLDAKWEALKSGGTYTYNNILYRYDGWVDLIRPGIFAEWIAMNGPKFTNSGYVSNAVPKEAKGLSPAPFIVKHWNEFMLKAGWARYYAYWADCYNQENTFYGFMKANESDYTGWEFVMPPAKDYL